MKITLVGAGNMGSAFVSSLSRAGHAVTITSGDAAKAQALAARHPGARYAAPAQAAAQAELVILATGYGAGLGTAITPAWLKAA
jgi:8-hydroxy-5-deazaflavin:NADPH oxidoreductase